MKYRVMLVLVALSLAASPGFAHWPHHGFGFGVRVGIGMGGFMPRPMYNPMFNPMYRPMLPPMMPPMLPPPVIVQPGFPGGQPLPPPQQFIPGFSRPEAINFDFHGVRPSAELKLRIQRTDPAVRKVLYQRALFTLKFESDELAKATADWVRTEIEHIAP